MRDVLQVLQTMGSEQLFLALVFLASYSLALGEFATVRGRLIAAVVACAAAGGFAAFSHPWEAGVVLLGFAFVGIGLFSAAAWMLWMAAARERGAFAQELAMNAPIAVAAASSRARNTAPILNSPAAE